ncbi:type IV pilin protein [Oxalobacteraceae bacterium CAVE-383]|nr:type IV pilin protein [Oxalobacteraceae bacterium CAVE-383]
MTHATHATHATRPSRQSAFTLIEMMTVLLIIAVLSTFAYPSYRQAKLKSARAEGRAALMRLMQQQERYYTGHHRYRHFAAGDGEDDGSGSNGDDALFHRFSGANDAASAYRLEARACESDVSDASEASDCLLLRAVPANGLADPACDILTLDSAGRQGASGGEACR